MEEPLTLSRTRIADFLVCRRRFQLRYLTKIPWPATRRDSDTERSRQLGERFHKVLQRHFLALPVGDEVESEPLLKYWWRLFRSYEPRIPDGRRLPELSLTVPIGRHGLTGRFDLVIVSEQRITIFDWKTFGKARTEEALRRDLQSKIYLALAAESGNLINDNMRPEEIILIYWFATDPPVERSLDYSQREHTSNWRNMTSIVDEIDDQLSTAGTWPLTDNLEECDRCAFQIYCGRGDGNPNFEDLTELKGTTPIEPALP